MKNSRDKLTEYLKSRGLRITAQRQLVLNEISFISDHFEVDDLFVRLHRKSRHTSRATVYRTLNLLVQGGFLREVLSGERHSHYENVVGRRHHDHLICLGCGKVIEFRSTGIEDLQNNVCQMHDFKPHGHRLEINGLCRSCQIKGD